MLYNKLPPKLTGLKQFLVLNIYYLRVSMDLVSQSDVDGKFCLGVTHEVAVKISAGARGSHSTVALFTWLSSWYQLLAGSLATSS